MIYRTTLVLIGIASIAATAGAADNAITDLKQLTVEDLMNVEVTSVARHPEKLFAAASAIQVITQEDIRRSGASSIPEVLRLADNLQVAQKNAHDWGISARGFNTDLANKLLVMIDGRTVYTPLYSGVFWDAQDYVLEDIDHIEVISGPGGALWGANAVNGVINIITKSAKDTQGLYSEAGGGDQPRGFVAARYGATAGSDTQYRVYGKYFDRKSEVLPGGGSADDDWRQGRGGFRVDSQLSSQDRLTLQGDIYSGHENTILERQSSESGENILGRWSRTYTGGDLALQSYVDRTHIGVPEGSLVIAGANFSPPGTLQDDLTTFDVDFQNRLYGSREQFVWGFGFRHTHDSVDNAPAVGFLPTTLNQSLYSAFVHNEFLLREDVSFTIGTKLEHNDYTGFEYEPDARLSWTVDSNQALWGAVSRAVRTPSRIDRDFTEGVPPYLVILKGSSDFQSEKVVAYEVGYRAELGPRLSTSISGFLNDYHDIRSTSITPVTLLPFYFANNLEGSTDGVELSGNYRATDAWSLHLGYTLLKEHLHTKPGTFDLSNALNETADPQHQVALRSSWNLPWRLEFDSALRWVDALHTNNGPNAGSVPSYFELNAHLSWHLSRQLELSITGENLLHAHHPEYGFPDPTRVEIERSAYGKFAWRY